MAVEIVLLNFEQREIPVTIEPVSPMATTPGSSTIAITRPNRRVWPPSSSWAACRRPACTPSKSRANSMLAAARIRRDANRNDVGHASLAGDHYARSSLNSA